MEEINFGTRSNVTIDMKLREDIIKDSLEIDQKIAQRHAEIYVRAGYLAGSLYDKEKQPFFKEWISSICDKIKNYRKVPCYKGGETRQVL